MKVSDNFERQVAEWGLDLSVEAKSILAAYARLLARYERANVIGTRDFGGILRRHILDSLSCLLFAPLRNARMVGDIGSGGGLPGIPLAVALPEAEITLFESTGKKAVFLRYAVEKLGLANVTVVNARIEESAWESEHRGMYEVCTARALARLSVIAEYSLPLLRRGGNVVAMKGRVDAGERTEGARALETLGGRVSQEIQVHYLPDVEQGERRLVLLEKSQETPGVYPRRTGTPTRDPLGAK
jgi:16S rRNA (guanine527-N7)-methyltransferase